MIRSCLCLKKRNYRLFHECGLRHLLLIRSNIAAILSGVIMKSPCSFWIHHGETVLWKKSPLTFHIGSSLSRKKLHYSRFFWVSFTPTRVGKVFKLLSRSPSNSFLVFPEMIGVDFKLKNISRFNYIFRAL